MANSPTKKATPDRGHIAANEVKYLSRHFGVSREDLQRAINKMGNSTSTVRKELGK